VKRLNVKPNSQVVPFVAELPISKLTPGWYQVEMKTMDSAGRTAKRNADFELADQ
jgi:hypothetical protein